MLHVAAAVLLHEPLPLPPGGRGERGALVGVDHLVGMDPLVGVDHLVVLAKLPSNRRHVRL